MITKIHTGTVHGGKFSPHDPHSFKTAFYRFEGKEVEVIVRKKVKKRSSEQNEYYWGVLLKLLSDETGFTQDELHDSFRDKFLSRQTKNFKILGSTAKLTTGEFEDYLSTIRQWSSQFIGMYLPLPNEAVNGLKI